MGKRTIQSKTIKNDKKPVIADKVEDGCTIKNLKLLEDCLKDKYPGYKIITAVKGSKKDSILAVIEKNLITDDNQDSDNTKITKRVLYNYRHNMIIPVTHIVGI